MKLSVNWLRELVDIPEDVDALCERLTILGLEVEEVQKFELLFPNVVVGKVLEAKQHPNADRLRVCRVSTGSEELAVVCGASNVRAGLTVALATPGAILPGDFKIKKSKIRGEVSNGMICSERELALGQGHEGILELAEEYEVGRPLDELFGYSDHRIEIEVTPNRPDWLSHIGVARELAAAYRHELRIPEPGAPVDFAEETGGWSARIEDAEGCRRFTGRLIDGVNIGESPLWLRQRLLAIGQRPINAVVDASNYVLHECGQPNHVFDRKKLEGTEIILRRAADGEEFTTLDDETRTLTAEHLLVADARGGVALAGIMGGANSEVDPGSSELLVEVAEFDPQVVRRGRRAVNLSTDASYRFERGIDPGRMEWATRRVSQLVVDACGGQAHPQAFASDGMGRPEPSVFFVRESQVERVVGARMNSAEMKGILERLGIEATPSTETGELGVRVVQPSFRMDLLEEIDAIEELARHFGYDKLELAERAPMLRPAERAAAERVATRLRRGLAGRRYHEVVSSSFMEEGDPDRLGLEPDDERRKAVRVLNPVVADAGLLKTSSLPDMLRIAGRNRRRGWTGPIRLFQLDRSFLARQDAALPDEPERLLLLWAGAAGETHFSVPERAFSIYDALGEVDSLLRGFRLSARRDPSGAESYHRPGAGAGLRLDELALGSVGELSPRVCAAFDLEETIHVAELDLAVLTAAVRHGHRFEPISAYPPVRRDLSLLLPEGVAFEAVEEIVRSGAGELLESLEVFDLYRGEGVPDGACALGLRLEFRSATGTLKQKKVDGLLDRILASLREDHGVALRDAAGSISLPPASKSD